MITDKRLDAAVDHIEIAQVTMNNIVKALLDGLDIDNDSIVYPYIDVVLKELDMANYIINTVQEDQ